MENIMVNITNDQIELNNKREFMAKETSVLDVALVGETYFDCC